MCIFFLWGAVLLSTRNHVWTCDVFKFMIPFALWIAQETFICEVEVMKSEITQCELAGEGEIVSRVLNPFLFKSSFFIFLFSSPFLFTLQMLPNAMPATQTAAASTATNGNQARHQSQPSAIKRHACHSDLCVRVLCVWESCV